MVWEVTLTRSRFYESATRGMLVSDARVDPEDAEP
jgi:hypothetical protein